MWGLEVLVFDLLKPADEAVREALSTDDTKEVARFCAHSGTEDVARAGS